MIHQRSRLRAFTLIELLVVIAIIGVLIALLLPAIQQAREAARRTQCRNNLKQLGLALHAYHETNGIFPPGSIGWATDGRYAWREADNGPPYQGTSWMLMILPYIGESNLYDQWNFGKTPYHGTSTTVTNPFNVDIPAFYCPSRRDSVRQGEKTIMFRNAGQGGTDYGGCIGGGNGFSDGLDPLSGATIGTTNGHDILGPEWVGMPGGRQRKCDGNTSTTCNEFGVFGPDRGLQIRDILDGTSKTIMIGEMQRLTGSVNINRSLDGWAIGGVSTMFDTDEALSKGMNSGFFQDAGSDHTGGAHFGMADGSVRFLAETIDRDVYEQLGTAERGDPQNDTF